LRDRLDLIIEERRHRVAVAIRIDDGETQEGIGVDETFPGCHRAPRGCAGTDVRHDSNDQVPSVG
jgi:hypothetical protein